MDGSTVLFIVMPIVIPIVLAIVIVAPFRAGPAWSCPTQIRVFEPVTPRL